VPGDVAARVTALRRAVAEAAARVGRAPDSVAIVAVAKTVAPGAVSEALAAGLRDVGENYVQEARAKRPSVRGDAAWHLIGRLQRNKARVALALFDRVHTVDSPALGALLAAEAARAGRRLPVLIQVNVAGESSKEASARRASSSSRGPLRETALALDGLMAVPPPAADPEESRPHFRLLREVRDRAEKRLGVELPHLSMGMSDDFRVAVEEGATLLRLGRALFGARGPGASRPGSSVGGEGS
jgi:pyridoxal phosphate enzyme (YggS family)